MKKMILLVFILFNIGCAMTVKADSSKDGSLQLDPSVITNSNGGVGNGSDFPEVANLFVQPQTNKSAFTTDVPTGKVHFGSPVKIKTIDYSRKTKQLFKSYDPQVITSSTDTASSQDGNKTIYIIGAIAVLPVVGISYLIGRTLARRRVRKEGGGNFD